MDKSDPHAIPLGGFLESDAWGLTGSLLERKLVITIHRKVFV